MHCFSLPCTSLSECLRTMPRYPQEIPYASSPQFSLCARFYMKGGTILVWSIQVLICHSALVIVNIFYLPTNAQVIVLKTVLKFTLKQLDMCQCSHTIFRELIIHTCQSYTLLKQSIMVHRCMIKIIGDVAAYINNVLVDVCMSHNMNVKITCDRV